MEIKYCTVITANPSRGDDVGRAEEGWYTIEGDLLTMVDADGAPLRDSNNGERITHKLAKGENPIVIAKRLVLKRHRTERGDDDGGFGRRISYERWSY